MLTGMTGMTETITERLQITPARAIVLRVMAADPRKPQYVAGLAETLGLPTPSVRNMMYRFEEAGWAVSSFGPRTRHMPRRYFTLTPHGLRAARAELKKWNFTDE